MPVLYPTPTTASKVGIIYGAVTGMVRGHVYCDTDAELDTFAARNLRSGEKMCFVPMADHLAGHDTFHQSIRNAVAADTPGLTAVLFAWEAIAIAHAHAVVDSHTNRVVNKLVVDINIDTDAAEHNWIHHGTDIVDIGHSYDPVNKVFNIPAVTLPAKLGGRNTERIIAATTVPAINPPASLNMNPPTSSISTR